MVQWLGSRLGSMVNFLMILQSLLKSTLGHSIHSQVVVRNMRACVRATEHSYFSFRFWPYTWSYVAIVLPLLSCWWILISIYGTFIPSLTVMIWWLYLRSDALGQGSCRIKTRGLHAYDKIDVTLDSAWLRHCIIVFFWSFTELAQSYPNVHEINMSSFALLIQLVASV